MSLTIITMEGSWKRAEVASDYFNEKSGTVEERLPRKNYISREMQLMSEMRCRSKKGTDKKHLSFSILLPSNLLPVPPSEEKNGN